MPGIISEDYSLAVPLSKFEELCLIQIREKLKSNEQHFKLPIPYMDDESLLLGYLRKMNFDLDQTLSTLLTTVKILRAFPEVFERSPSAIQKYMDIYDTKHTYPLRYRDEYGRQIILSRPGKLNFTKHSVLDVLYSNFPLVEAFAKKQITQLNGIVLILDLSEVGVSHLQMVPFEILKLLAKVTNISSIKIKGIHIVNNTFITTGIWKIMQGFLKPKIRNRVHIHGFNTESLHKYFSKEILPEEYGGKLSLDEALEPNFIQTILAKDKYYQSKIK